MDNIDSLCHILAKSPSRNAPRMSLPNQPWGVHVIVCTYDGVSGSCHPVGAFALSASV
jgi:hypothetical protein